MSLTTSLRVLALVALVSLGSIPSLPWFPAARAATEAQSDAILARAFRERTSKLQVEGSGEVTKLLADDTKGSRHQRFILRLRSGQTLMIAHNIDLAPRVPGVKERDQLSFYGEYEWNAQGGVIHWTHRDPAGRHLAGWLKHKGRTYQ